MGDATSDGREVRVSSLAGVVDRFDRGVWARIVDAGMLPARGAPQTVRVADAQRLVDDHDGLSACALMRHIEMPDDIVTTVRLLADLGVRSGDVLAEGALIGYVSDGLKGRDGVADPRKDTRETVAALCAIGLRVALAAEHYRRLERVDG